MDTGTISESEWMVFQEVETIKQILGIAKSTEISLKLKGTIDLSIDTCILIYSHYCMTIAVS